MAGKTRRTAERREPADEEPGPSPERRRPEGGPRRAAPRKRGRRRKGSLRVGRIVYWGAVAALWLVIAAIGVLFWVGSHLPPIQSLEIPKRPPSIQIVGLDGRVLANRGEMGGAAVPLKELPPYLHTPRGIQAERGEGMRRTRRGCAEKSRAARQF